MAFATQRIKEAVALLLPRSPCTYAPPHLNLCGTCWLAAHGRPPAMHCLQAAQHYNTQEYAAYRSRCNLHLLHRVLPSSATVIGYMAGQMLASRLWTLLTCCWCPSRLLCARASAGGGCWALQCHAQLHQRGPGPVPIAQRCALLAFCPLQSVWLPVKICPHPVNRPTPIPC